MSKGRTPAAPIKSEVPPVSTPSGDEGQRAKTASERVSVYARQRRIKAVSPEIGRAIEAHLKSLGVKTQTLSMKDAVGEYGVVIKVPAFVFVAER